MPRRASGWGLQASPAAPAPYLKSNPAQATTIHRERMRPTRPTHPVPGRSQPPPAASGPVFAIIIGRRAAATRRPAVDDRNGNALSFTVPVGRDLCTCLDSRYIMFMVPGFPTRTTLAVQHPLFLGRRTPFCPTTSWPRMPVPLDTALSSPPYEPFSLIVPVQSAGGWSKQDGGQGSSLPCRWTLAGRSRRA